VVSTQQLGIGKEKATEITDVVQKYGNLIGFGKLQESFICVLKVPMPSFIV
jgi:hypothetical protein